MTSEKPSITFRLIILFLFLVCLPAFIAGSFESIKPTEAYIDSIHTIALVAAFITLVLTFGVVFFPPRNYTYLDDKMNELKTVIGMVLMPLFVAFIAYQSFIVGFPVLLHPISNPQPVQIKISIIEKDYDRGRGARFGLTCRYKLRFEHPDIPERNYICATESFWEQVEENSVLTVSVQKSRFAYHIPDQK